MQIRAAREMLSRWADLTGNDRARVKEIEELAAQYDSTGVPSPGPRFAVAAVFPQQGSSRYRAVSEYLEG